MKERYHASFEEKLQLMLILINICMALQLLLQSPLQTEVVVHN